MNSGKVVTWGYSGRGGDSSQVQRQLSDKVQHIYSNDGAFAAVLADGMLVTWGDPYAGGDSSGVQDQVLGGGGVKHVYSNPKAFAAVLYNGANDRVVTFGYSPHGGNSDDVQKELSDNGGVRHIYHFIVPGRTRLRPQAHLDSSCRAQSPAAVGRGLPRGPAASIQRNL